MRHSCLLLALFFVATSTALPLLETAEPETTNSTDIINEPSTTEPSYTQTAAAIIAAAAGNQRALRSVALKAKNMVCSVDNFSALVCYDLNDVHFDLATECSVTDSVTRCARTLASEDETN
jgi:hypothetical protein